MPHACRTVCAECNSGDNLGEKMKHMVRNDELLVGIAEKNENKTTEKEGE